MSIQKKITNEMIDRMIENCETVAKNYTGEFKPGDEGLGQVLRRDPVAEAEILSNVLGVTSKDRDMFLLGHAARINKHRDCRLIESDDTSFSNTVERYHRIIGEMGFEKVLEIPFVSRKWEENRDERLYLFWRAKGGLLLRHDTFCGKTVNGADLYFNWRSKGVVRHPERVSSSYFMKDETGKVSYDELYPHGSKTTDPAVLERERLWIEKCNRETVNICSMDCREAIRYHIDQLEETGEFVTPWVERPFLWLLHYDDVAGGEGTYDYRTINEDRITMLPDHVKEAITP